eukprot:3122396-Lingulodinium_polyedra.AAC.1
MVRRLRRIGRGRAARRGAFPTLHPVGRQGLPARILRRAHDRAGGRNRASQRARVAPGAQQEAR